MSGIKCYLLKANFVRACGLISVCFLIFSSCSSLYGPPRASSGLCVCLPFWGVATIPFKRRHHIFGVTLRLFLNLWGLVGQATRESDAHGRNGGVKGRRGRSCDDAYLMHQAGLLCVSVLGL